MGRKKKTDIIKDEIIIDTKSTEISIDTSNDDIDNITYSSEELSTYLPDPMINKKSTFFGNPLLKREREAMNLTKEHIIELKKCANDPIYFASKYMKIVNVDKGLMTIELYPYQKKILKGLKENRNVIVLSARQSGKCVFDNTLIHIKNKKYNDGKPIDIKIEIFYSWIKFKNAINEYINE